MPPKISKQVSVLSDQTEHLSNVVNTFLPTWQERTQDLFQTHLPGQKAPDTFAFLNPYLALLNQRLQALQKANQDVLLEEGEDQAALHLREEVLETTREGLVQLKQTLGGLLGSDFLDSIALQGETPSHKTPDKLVDTLHSAIELLRPMTQLPSVSLPGFTLNKDTIEKNLASLHNSLDQAVKGVRQERVETSQARIRRNEAIEDVRSILSLLNGLLSGIALFVQDEEGRQKVRFPSQKRSKSSTTSSSQTPTDSSSTSPTE